jgi:hypothetical protein
MNALTANQTTILKHVQDNLLIDENIEDGKIEWNFVESDIVMDIREGKLDAKLDFADIDVVFTALNEVEELIDACCKAIREAK